MMKPLPTGQTPESILALHETAADWHIRRQQADWSSADERAMNAWLDADPLHREIMDGLASTWLHAEQLKTYRPQVYGRQPADAAPPSARPAAPAPRAPQRRRWLVPALIAACAMIATGGWYRWDTTASYTLDVTTGAGETRELDLPDGTRIALNIDSTLQVRYYPRRRETVLDRGEAFFRVAADGARPFTVDSGASQVRVVGTAFNVRAAPPRLVVKVSEGRVEVRPGRTAPPVLVLGPGAGVGIDPATGSHQSLPVAAEDMGDWRSGQIHFSRTPLADVAQELSRYLGKPVTVADDHLAAVPVSGFLAVQAPENFIRSLPDVAPVRVQREPDGGWRISVH